MKTIIEKLAFTPRPLIPFGLSLLSLLVLGTLLTVRISQAADPSLESNSSSATDKQFQERTDQLLDLVQSTYRKNGEAAATQQFEAGARQLLKDFPGRPEPYEMLVEIGGHEPADKAKALALEIIKSTAPEEIKQRAQALLARSQASGQPLDIQYTALDGRKVDLQSLHGKVVLVDFWATWCEACLAELPTVKSVYAQFHSQGFEILGVSFDQDKSALASFVKRNAIPWPQYFDGQGWQNQYVKKLGIEQLPTMWLVNKKGILVDMSGTVDLSTKVQKLLAEP